MFPAQVTKWSDGIDEFYHDNLPEPTEITSEHIKRVAEEVGYAFNETGNTVRLYRVTRSKRFKFWANTKKVAVDTIFLPIETSWEARIDGTGITYSLVIPSYYGKFPRSVCELLGLPTQHRVDFEEPVVFLPYPLWDDRETEECLAFKSEVRQLISPYIAELITIARECKHGGG